MPKPDFHRLFQTYRTELLAYLTRKVRDTETAAELTQETFTRFIAHGTGGSAAAITNERAYLYRMAHNLAIDHVRLQRSRPAQDLAEDDLSAIADQAPSPEQAVTGKQELGKVREFLSTMPPRTREIFVLQRVHGMTYRAIAEQLGISESSVQKHMAKGVKHLMQHLRAPE